MSCKERLDLMLSENTDDDFLVNLAESSDDDDDDDDDDDEICDNDCLPAEVPPSQHLVEDEDESPSVGCKSMNEGNQGSSSDTDNYNCDILAAQPKALSIDTDFL